MKVVFSHALAVILLNLKLLASFHTFFRWRTEPNVSRTTTGLLLRPQIQAED